MKNKAKIKLHSKTNGSVLVEVIANKIFEQVVFTVKKDGNVLFYQKYVLQAAKLFNNEFYIRDPLLWSLSDPALYGYRVEITYADGENETLSGRFGFREIGQNGKNITINGKPVYIRGYIRGAKAHDHANLLGLSLKDFYLKNLKAAKKFGFNYVRFHSVVPEE